MAVGVTVPTISARTTDKGELVDRDSGFLVKPVQPVTIKMNPIREKTASATRNFDLFMKLMEIL
jgi:hypothetical protein